jgi:hypothetical protein
MAAKIFPFLEWETRFYVDLLHQDMVSVFNDKVPAYNAAVAGLMPITVNHFRKSMPGVLPHPDERGDMKVWEDNITKDTDATIPPELLAGAWNKIVLSKAFMGERTEQDSFEFLTQYFAQLYAEAKATKLPIFKSFEDVPKQEG